MRLQTDDKTHLSITVTFLIGPVKQPILSLGKLSQSSKASFEVGTQEAEDGRLLFKGGKYPCSVKKLQHSYYLPFFIKGPKSESSVSQIQGVKMLYLDQSYVKFREKLGKEPAPSFSSEQEEEEEEEEKEEERIKEKSPPEEKKTKHRRKGDHHSEGCRRKKKPKVCAKEERAESPTSRPAEREKPQPREPERTEYPKEPPPPRRLGVELVEASRTAEESRGESKRPRSPQAEEPKEPSADYGGDYDDESHQSDSESEDLRYRTAEARADRAKEDTEPRGATSSSWKPGRYMSEEEKKRMNYESRQRKRAKKAALKEQADQGKGQPSPKGKGKAKSRGKGKSAKSRDAAVRQLEQFGWICAVGHEEAEAEEPQAAELVAVDPPEADEDPAAEIERLSAKTGWEKTQDGDPVLAKRGTTVFQTPAPRFSRHKLRTTWTRREGQWVKCEDQVEWSHLEDPSSLIPDVGDCVVTVFHK